MTDFRPAQSPAEGEAAAIPCNCWLDDEPPCPSPCVFDDPREEVNNCSYAAMIESANKKKTDCKHYRAATAQLEPQGHGRILPPDYIDPEHIGEDRQLLKTFYAACNSEGGTTDEIHLRGLSAVLARWGRPTTPLQPVPVSERLPGPEDCDEKGRCWVLSKVEPQWRLASVLNPAVPRLHYCFSHWLPAHALPLPDSGEVEE